MSHHDKPSALALVTLIVLQVVMLTALYSKTSPHPPEAVVLFGIAPFLAVSLSAAIGAFIFDTVNSLFGRVLCVSAALMALLSFGPQKYFDPQFPLVWPSVIIGQMAAIVLIYRSFKTKQNRA